jgi:hypothetical protein
MSIGRLIDLSTIDRLTAGRVGEHDVPCPPLCGPGRRSPIDRGRHTLRIWRVEPGFATFSCVRCGERGYARDRSAPPPDSESEAHGRIARMERRADAVPNSRSQTGKGVRDEQPMGTLGGRYGN